MEKKKFLDNDDSGKIILFSLVATFVWSILVSMIGEVIATNNNWDSDTVYSSLPYLCINILGGLIVNVVVYLLYSRTKKISYNAVNLNFKMRWHTYLISIVVGVLAIFCLQYFISIFDNLLAMAGYKLEEGLKTIDPTNFGEYILAVLLVAVVPAISEELLYRGVLLSGLREKFKDWVAVLISALFFALMHGSLQQFVYPLIMGLVYGWLYTRSGSLVTTMLAHFTNNFIVVTFAFIKNTTGFSFAINFGWKLVLAGVILAAVGVVTWGLIDKFYFKKQSAEYKVEKGLTRLSVFMLIAFVAVVMLFAISVTMEIVGIIAGA